MGAVNVDVDLLKDFAWYSAVLLVKVFATAVITSLFRFKSLTFASEEDCVRIPGAKTGHDEGVERARRAHRNDLENVLPFVMLGLIYVLYADPSPFFARLHFQAFTIARILHTIVYVLQIPQPARGLAFGVGILVCLSLFLQIVF